MREVVEFQSGCGSILSFNFEAKNIIVENFTENNLVEIAKGINQRSAHTKCLSGAANCRRNPRPTRSEQSTVNSLDDDKLSYTYKEHLSINI
jgi:hypothetical protein